MTTKKKRKAEKAPPMDKLLIPAIGVALAMMGYKFYQGIMVGDGNMSRVDVMDGVALREVFFGELSGTKNYAVLCSKEEDSYLSSVFTEASVGGTTAEFRLLDCDYKLPDSGKTIAERFKLNLKKRPTIFISGASVGEPKQIPEKHLKTGGMLIKALKSKLEKRAVKIETTQDLRTKCLNQDYCALLMKGSSKPVDSSLKKSITKLVVEQPKMVFASIDTSNLYLKNLEEFLPEFQKGQHRFVVFSKIMSKTKDSRLLTSIASLPENKSLSYGPLSNLCADVLSGAQAMKRLTTLPMIKTRTKKVEAEDWAKRERKKEQEERANENANAPTASPIFADNDGSKEGRRAERERRRADHRAKTGLKPKTPEEIAEMERQRRIRMQEAEAAWNVEDGEFSEEGKPIDIDDYDDISEDGEDHERNGDEEDSSADDGDVMDLD